VIEDLDSTNGVRVNGTRVQRHVLRHGDVVDLGRHRLQYLEESPLPDPAGGDAAPARVRVLSGRGVGRETELTASVLPLGKPGGERAVIERRGDDYVLARLCGPCPPLVNGEPVGEGGHSLRAGDVVEVAGIRYEFLAV
jgi:ribosome-associated protein YbcJ (S4-like RNA binding protein)